MKWEEVVASGPVSEIQLLNISMELEAERLKLSIIPF